AEKLLSYWTDLLVTINHEDYQMCKNHNFLARDIKMVNGVGVNLSEYSFNQYQSKLSLRDKYGYGHNDFILICIAELNWNKHQDFLIYSIERLKKMIPNIKLLLVGEGTKHKEYDYL